MNYIDSVQISKEIFDVIIVGAGLSGIIAANKLADQNKKVLLVTEAVICSGSSFYPMMDTIHCQAPIDEADKEIFLKDIRDMALSLHDEELNKYYLDHINQEIAYLGSIGFPVVKLPEVKLACFASHPHSLYKWTDWKKIRSSVKEHLDSKKNISILEKHTLFSFILRENSFAGAVFISGQQVTAYQAPSLLLATGGFGSLYKHNLNTSDVSGLSHSLVLKAGGRLVNLEFNQFIPGFINPAYKVVFREGSLDYCEGLFNSKGVNVLKEAYPDDETLKNLLSLRAPHGPFTLSDGSENFDFILLKAARETEDNKVLIKYRPEILEDKRSFVIDYIKWLKDELKVDISSDPIYIAPFFHAANGGVVIDHNCQTDIPGIYACGETAGGIHGANRIGGNASGSCLVFGSLAAKSIASREVNVSSPLTKEEVSFSISSTYDNNVFDNSNLSETYIIDRVKDLMWSYANVSRSEEGLNFALSEIRKMEVQFNPYKRLTSSHEKDRSRSIAKASASLSLSSAVLTAMLLRKESRGSHYREDYPKMNPNFSSKIYIHKELL